MLEHMKKPLTDSVFLGVICKRALLDEVKTALEAKGCTVKQAQDIIPDPLPEKEHYTIEDTFPDFHAGHSLIGARYREDISQRQLAKLTGVSVQNISAMEHGRRTIGKEMAKRFAKVLNTDWRLLLS